VPECSTSKVPKVPVNSLFSVRLSQVSGSFHYSFFPFVFFNTRAYSLVSECEIERERERERDVEEARAVLTNR
jgi:hypothetical protein